jgi:hypothetical protein
MTNSSIRHKLEREITSLAKKDTSIKILKKGNAVLVNNKTVRKASGYFKISNYNHLFLNKKSAVAYAVCMITNNSTLAEQIRRLDTQYRKLVEDVSWYNHTAKNTNSEFKKISVYNRLSEARPRLVYARDELKQLLKTVEIA